MRTRERVAAGAGLTALTLFSWVPLAGRPAKNGAMITAREGESTGQLIQAASQACHAQPAAPGVRPGFIPRAVLLVRGGLVLRVSLAEGLDSPSDAVAWCP